METIAFQAETKELLSLVIHSLYTHREVFLRELISNASDALDKLRFEALTNPDLLPDPDALGIHLALDTEARVLCVIDNGIGMGREELVDNLGTIARSGTKRFLEALKEGEAQGKSMPELIGQFGVGFYSAFMVADEVVVETRRAGDEQGLRWTSDGEGEFSLEETEKPTAGTTVMLHLKPLEEGEEDFAQEHAIRGLVKRYSDFIEYPVQMEVGEGDEKKTETLNSQTPIWCRPRSEVKDDEYEEFYKHVSHDWSKPVEHIHFKAEGTTEYTALLYLPRHRPMDLFDPSNTRSRIHLYVKRVSVMPDCEDLLPPWLRFVRGIVDSSDLPLNVSRETLQHDRQLRQIQKRLVRKVLDSLGTLREKRAGDYGEFWDSFGVVLKEGLYHSEEHREELAKIALWDTSHGEERTTLPEYVERMPVKQKVIYVLPCPDRASGERSPHAETFKARGFEVLYLTDPVDEFVLQRMNEFEGKKLQQVDRGDLDLDEDESADERSKLEEELGDVLEPVRKELADRVEDVRFSRRLTDSPACLVFGEEAMPPAMLRFMRESGQAVPEPKRTLELNAGHPLVKRMQELSKAGATQERFADYCELLMGQALISEGSAPEDPVRFSKLLTELMIGAK